jgi:integrase
MALVKAVVYEEFKKTDGTYHVKIKVFHQKKKRFIDTMHFLSVRQLDSDLKIKDKFILNELSFTLNDYRKTIGGLGPKLDFMTCDDLKAFLEGKDEEIDFVKFCNHHVEASRQDGRDGTAKNHAKIRNSLVDYFGKERISIIEINAAMLYQYEKWLRRDRVMTRINQLGKPVTTKKKGMKDGGIYPHMRDLRTLFNEACRLYNNEDLGLVKIKHYPFKVYKIGAPPKTKKRNIAAEQIIALQKCVLPPDSRAELARDLFMLSFYLCGMNAVDLYKLDRYDPSWERLDYNRSKTEGIRDDDAFISIKIVKEARPLLAKYMGTLQARYSTSNGLDTALSKGMELVRTVADLPELTFYWARHSFASIARNKCRMNKDDIAEALNHVDGEHRTTDIYIEKDWSIIDDVQAAVIDYIRALLNPPPKVKQQAVVKPINAEKQRSTMRLVIA